MRLTRKVFDKGKGEAGQAVIETLMVMPFLLLMVVAVFGAGSWAYYKLAAQNLAYSTSLVYARQVEMSPVNPSRELANYIGGMSNATSETGANMISPLRLDDMTANIPSRLQNNAGLSVIMPDSEVWGALWAIAGLSGQTFHSVGVGMGSPFIACDAHIYSCWGGGGSGMGGSWQTHY